MKHSLILSLCAALVAAFGLSSANAVTDVSLNLYYTDPASPSSGGTWNLVAKTDSAGIVGLAFMLDPNTIGLVGHEIGSTTTTYPSSYTIPNVTAATLNHNILGNALGVNDLTDPNEPGYYEFLYGQDPNGGGYTSGIGAGVGSLGADPLHNSAWDGASLIASGVFGAARPQFSSVFVGAANELDPNGDPVECAPGACFNVTVRGDSMKGTAEEDPNEGLLAGDANRSGTVDFLDFSALSGNYLQPGSKTWDQGDFNSSTGGSNEVDFLDFSALSGNYLKPGFNPPTIGAVPEPASLILFASCGLMGLWMRRRS